MKSQITIPNKRYFNKAYQILMNGDVNVLNNKYSYYRLNEKIFTSEQFKYLLESNGLQKRYKISSGTSDRLAYKGFITQAITDLKKGTYYRSYAPPKGNIIIRKALSYMENLKFATGVYTEEDICMTEGSTGGVTMIFEYLKRESPTGAVLIVGPTYYLYKFTAEYYGLTANEMITTNGDTSFTVDANELERSITPQTKLIVLARPNNPLGEIYSDQLMETIMLIAQKKKILVLVDEIFFELIFKNAAFTESDVIASQNNTLNQLVVVKGYSKNKNLAAFRMGYLLTKNNSLMNYLEKIAEQRQCFASAQNYIGLICLDAYIQSVQMLMKKNDDLNTNIKIVKKAYSFSPTIAGKSNTQLKKLYLSYQRYFKKKMKFYSDSYDVALDLLKDDIDYALPKQTAFNTLVKIKGLEKINYFDFCLNLFLTTGIETQIGPCFGFDQKKWQSDPNLGYWLRITFARDRKTFIEGIKKFREFKKVYLENQNKFLKTNRYF